MQRTKKPTPVPLLRRKKPISNDTIGKYSIPNKTLLKWVEENAPDIFNAVRSTMTIDPVYNTSKDIYHQHLNLVFKHLYKYLSYNDPNYQNRVWEWLDTDLKQYLIEMQQKRPLLRRKK